MPAGGDGMSEYERCRAALEAAVDTLRYGKATRPTGFDWENHRDLYLDFAWYDDPSATDAARRALADWYGL